MCASSRFERNQYPPGSIAESFGDPSPWDGFKECVVLFGSPVEFKLRQTLLVLGVDIDRKTLLHGVDSIRGRPLVGDVGDVDAMRATLIATSAPGGDLLFVASCMANVVVHSLRDTSTASANGLDIGDQSPQSLPPFCEVVPHGQHVQRARRTDDN